MSTFDLSLSMVFFHLLNSSLKVERGLSIFFINFPKSLGL